MMTWFSNPFNQILLVLLAFGFLGWKRGNRLWSEWKEFQVWRRNQRLQPNSSSSNQLNVPDESHRRELLTQTSQPQTPLAGLQAPFAIDFNALPTAAVPGVPQALLAPPSSLWYTIEYIRRYASKPYTFGLGWWITPEGDRNLIMGSFVNDIYDLLLTAIKRGGKDNALMNILFPLMLLHSPDEFQLVIIDGKRIDYFGWEQKAHVWHLAAKPHDVPMAMELISAEREDRINWLNANGRSRWEEIPVGQRRPMLVILVSEIKILIDQVGASTVEKWLSEEMTVMGALGMRMIVASQNTSGQSKEWRSQFEFMMAGTQPSRDEVKPNTGRSVTDLREMGVVAPCDLPDVGSAPGVFTLVHGSKARNVRTSYIDDEQRTYWLSLLPTTTPAEFMVRNQHKTHILKNLVQERMRIVIEQEMLKNGVYTYNQHMDDQQSAQDSDSTTSTTSRGYDEAALQEILATRTYAQLPAEPLFQSAVAIEFARSGSRMAVCRQLWSEMKPNGSQQTAVAKTLEQRSRDNEQLLQELLPAMSA